MIGSRIIETFFTPIANKLSAAASKAYFLQIPLTGDENKPLIWIIIAVAAALGIVVAIILLTKKNK